MMSIKFGNISQVGTYTKYLLNSYDKANFRTSQVEFYLTVTLHLCISFMSRKVHLCARLVCGLLPFANIHDLISQILITYTTSFHKTDLKHWLLNFRKFNHNCNSNLHFYWFLVWRKYLFCLLCLYRYLKRIIAT